MGLCAIVLVRPLTICLACAGLGLEGAAGFRLARLLKWFVGCLWGFGAWGRLCACEHVSLGLCLGGAGLNGFLEGVRDAEVGLGPGPGAMGFDLAGWDPASGVTRVLHAFRAWVTVFTLPRLAPGGPAFES